MSISDWSTTADDNTTVDGINIDENCPPSNINNAIRAVMAAVAEGDFATLAALAIPSGAEAARPSDPDTGQIFYNTDTDSLEVYNGEEWVSDRNPIATSIDTSDPSDTVVVSEEAIVEWGKDLGWGLEQSEGVDSQSANSRSLTSGVHRSGGGDTGDYPGVGSFILARGWSGSGEFGEQWQLYNRRDTNDFYVRGFDASNDLWLSPELLITEADVGTGADQVPTNSDLEDQFAGVYTGGTQNETNFPIGHTIMAELGSDGDGYTRNATVPVKYQGGDSRKYQTSGSGNELAGTWRARGASHQVNGSFNPVDYIVERTA